MKQYHLPNCRELSPSNVFPPLKHFFNENNYFKRWEIDTYRLCFLHGCQWSVGPVSMVLTLCPQPISLKLDGYTKFLSHLLLPYHIPTFLLSKIDDLYPNLLKIAHPKERSTLKRLNGICFWMRKLLTLSWSTRSKNISFPICSTRSSSLAT